MPLASAEPSPPLETADVAVGGPWIPGQAVEIAVGVDAKTQVGQVGARENDRAGVLETGDDQRVRPGVLSREGGHAVRGRRARYGDVVLDRDRHAVQRPQLGAGGHRFVGRLCRRASLVGEDANNRVQVAVYRVDARQVGLDHVEARDLAAPDRRRQLAGAGAPQVIGHRARGHGLAAVRRWGALAASDQEPGGAGQRQGVEHLAPRDAGDFLRLGFVGRHGWCLLLYPSLRRSSRWSVSLSTVSPSIPRTSSVTAREAQSIESEP